MRSWRLLAVDVEGVLDLLDVRMHVDVLLLFFEDSVRLLLVAFRFSGILSFACQLLGRLKAQARRQGSCLERVRHLGFFALQDLGVDLLHCWTCASYNVRWHQGTRFMVQALLHGDAVLSRNWCDSLVIVIVHREHALLIKVAAQWQGCQRLLRQLAVVAERDLGPGRVLGRVYSCWLMGQDVLLRAGAQADALVEESLVIELSLAVGQTTRPQFGLEDGGWRDVLSLRGHTGVIR